MPQIEQCAPLLRQEARVYLAPSKTPWPDTEPLGPLIAGRSRTSANQSRRRSRPYKKTQRTKPPIGRIKRLRCPFDKLTNEPTASIATTIAQAAINPATQNAFSPNGNTSPALVSAVKA